MLNTGVISRQAIQRDRNLRYMKKVLGMADTSGYFLFQRGHIAR